MVAESSLTGKFYKEEIILMNLFCQIPFVIFNFIPAIIRKYSPE